MCPLGRLLHVRRAALQPVAHANPLDYEHLVLELDLSLGRRFQPALVRRDATRLQRAAQGPRESTGGGGDYVIECGGTLIDLVGPDAVVLTDCAVGAEHDRFGFRRQPCPPDRSSLANDPDPRSVKRRVPAFGHHNDQATASRVGWGSPPAG